MSELFYWYSQDSRVLCLSEEMEWEIHITWASVVLPDRRPPLLPSITKCCTCSLGSPVTKVGTVFAPAHRWLWNNCMVSYINSNFYGIFFLTHDYFRPDSWSLKKLQRLFQSFLILKYIFYIKIKINQNQ